MAAELAVLDIRWWTCIPQEVRAFEPCGMIDRLYAVAVSGLVSGPFAIYKSPHANGFTLVHLPSQAKTIDLEMQNCCKDAAEKFAALDLNWWTCIPEEVIGPRGDKVPRKLKGQFE